MDHHHDRLAAVTDAAVAQGLDVVLIGPGANLEYLTGYRGSITTERLTCLVLVPGRDPLMFAPLLEQPLVEWALQEGADLSVVTWADGDDWLDRLIALLPATPRRIAVDGQMWFDRWSAMNRRLPTAEVVSAGPMMERLRSAKTPAEIAALEEAGAAIDTVHANMGQWLRAGRREREVGADVAAAILAAGHQTVEFVIVAAGPNSASPHAEVTDRVIQPGEPVVVDIGGRMPSGYNSDCTRTYLIGEPSEDFARLYAVLLHAQQVQCAVVRPGVLPEDVDAAGRAIITDAGFGPEFMHRTGHGIGLETHEAPYIVRGGRTPLEAGATFSIEPGIYRPRVGGARIEDIVVCEPGGARRLNRGPRDLQILDP